MRATVGVKEFRKAVQAASCATDNRVMIPILGMLRLTVDASGTLSVTGTDLNIEITGNLPTISSEPGSICVPGRLKALLKYLPNWESISIRTADDDRVVVDMPDGRTSFIGTPADEFPSLTKASESDASFEFESRALRREMETVARFICYEETRYYLNGIMMRIAKGWLQFVATDGHKLIRQDVMESEKCLEPRIVPRGTVAKLLKVLPSEGKMCLSFNSAGTRVDICSPDGSLAVRSKLIDGQFPDFERLIPADPYIKTVYELKRESVLGATKRLGNLFQQNRCFEFVEEKDGRIALSRTDKESGSAICAIAGSRLSGTHPIALGIDHRILHSATSAHHQPRVKISFCDAGSPLKFETPGTLTLAMPMRCDLAERMMLPDGAVA